MEKISTGVPGLDRVLKGGVNRGSPVLVTGAPGTGKTIMALQFLIEGAKKGEQCLCITSEESAEALREYADVLGLNLRFYEEKGLIIILEKMILGEQTKLEIPLHIIKEKKIKRVVVDSLTFFKYVYLKEEEFRKGLLAFVHKLNEQKINLLATSETETTNLDEFRYRTEDYIFNGLIILTKIREGSSFVRCINVAKMRGQDHLIDIYPFTIEKGGLKIYPEQIPFSL